ncbi:MAG: phage prohead protein [Bacteroidales bacterium]|nr:phage prohead protein [Bacteroidales bacterium]
MKEQMINLQYETKALDVTEKGIVTVGVNGIGIEDSQHDISMPGSFTDTLRDDIKKMRWYLNHDTRQLLGVPLSGEEKDGNLIMTGQMNLNKQICRDVFEDYKLFHEAGRTLEHSIGVKALARDEADRRKVKKWRMLEYSTLTGWGSNPQTFLVGLKSGTADQLRDAADFIRMAFKHHGYSDERLKNYDMELNLLLKSLSGGLVVTCPCCGHQFDYDREPEHAFSQEVLDAASEFISSIGRNEARRQIERYRPEIQEAVASIIDGMAATQKDLTTKSITDAVAFVRCPHCWSRVYRANTLLIPDSTEPKEDKSDESGESKGESAQKKSAETPAPSPSFWETLNAAIQK